MEPHYSNREIDGKIDHWREGASQDLKDIIARLENLNGLFVQVSEQQGQIAKMQKEILEIREGLDLVKDVKGFFRGFKWFLLMIITLGTAYSVSKGWVTDLINNLK
jgi:prefoldin subunit 5